MSQTVTAVPSTAAERLAAVRREIARGLPRGRARPRVGDLVAISKTFGAEAIEPVIAAGQRVFGENRVQEAKAKWPALKAQHPGIELHLVGPLQSNKAKEAVALFDAIHSVDRPSLCRSARQGDRPAGPAADPVRRGQHRRRAAEGRRAAGGGRCVPAACRETYGLTIAGLMCIPPFDEPPAPHFALTAKIARAQRTEASFNGHERRLRARDRNSARPMCGSERRSSGRAACQAALRHIEWRSGFRVPPAPRSRRSASARSATQPAVGDRSGRATCTKTALPRPAMRGRVLWSSSTTKS